MYKVPYSTSGVGGLSSLLGKEYQVVKRQGNIMAEGKNITWVKRERGSNIIIPIMLRLWRRISNEEKGKESEILGKKIKI